MELSPKMTRGRVALSALAVLCIAACAGSAGPERPAFLRDAAPARGGGTRAAVIDAAETSGAPVVSDSVVHFVYRDGEATAVSVAGDFNGWNADADPMRRLPGSDVWYLRRVFEPDARLDYKLVVDGDRWILDPWNDRTVTGGFGPNSAFAMPAYEPPAEIERRVDVPRGRIDTLRFRSDTLENDRDVFVYLPPGYRSGGERRYPLLLVHDGGDYLQLGAMATILDNLLADGEIAPLVAVFVDPVDRRGEYALSFVFADAVADELLPFISSRYAVSGEPARRGVMGASLGGLVSVFLSFERPDLFGFCASQSGAFGVADDRLIRRIDAQEPRPIGLWLDWGTYEERIASSNRRLAASLAARGYEFRATVVHEGHSWGSWRARIDDILRAFSPAEEER